MVTVEAAIALMGVIAVLAMCLAGIGTVRNQAALCQVVREAARAAAVAESVDSAGMAGAPGSAQVTVLEVGKWVHARGVAPAVELGGLRLGTVECQAAVLSEAQL